MSEEEKVNVGGVTTDGSIICDTTVAQPISAEFDPTRRTAWLLHLASLKGNAPPPSSRTTVSKRPPITIPGLVIPTTAETVVPAGMRGYAAPPQAPRGNRGIGFQQSTQGGLAMRGHVRTDLPPPTGNFAPARTLEQLRAILG